MPSSAWPALSISDTFFEPLQRVVLLESVFCRELISLIAFSLLSGSKLGDCSATQKLDEMPMSRSKSEPKLCSIDTCGRAVVARGWCDKHYQRWKFYGDPTAILCSEKGENLRWIRETAAPYVGDDCLLWPFGSDKKQRPTIRIDGRTKKAARVICELVHGTPPSSTHETAHSCGEGSCVNPNHLRWATHVDNEADKLLHGTRTRGHRNHHCRLTESDVRSIRRLRSSMTLKELGDRYGISFSTVSAIITRRSWAWLD